MGKFNKSTFSKREFSPRREHPVRREFGRSRDERSESRFERRDGARGGTLEFHKAVCRKCGADCEVPFKPTQNKPVFCRSCFLKQSGDMTERPSRAREERESRVQGSSSELENINRKLDKIMKALGIE
jgi:CxxC-x17-CxxC domain-containing protein